MRNMKKVLVVGLALLGSLVVGSTGAQARNPEFALPEKVEVKHKACQEILRLAATYQVEGLFSKEFEAGQVCYTRTDLAVVLELLTEKLAEKVVKEGSAAVAKEDLVLLAELQDELRGEMLLARTRTFQQRREGLGTRLTAITKNISLSGGLVGVLQGSIGNEPSDHVDVVGRGDLVFSFKVGENTIAVIDVEATGGNGIDTRVPSFSLLNAVAGSTGDTVRFREAWVEHAAFDERLILTAGKIDLTNYFDANGVANDENSQFLAGAFVNSAVLGAPGNGPGARLQAKLGEPLTFGLGYGSGDTDTEDVFSHGYGIAELDYTLKVGELEGNYRVYGSLDGARADGEVKLQEKNAFGFGISADQQVTDKLTLFVRYGQRDEDVYATKMAWSAGGQYAGLLPERKDDVLGFAYGQVKAVGADSQEKLAELYYKVQVNEQISIAPVVQYLINPLGDSSRDDVVALGLRSLISF
ncbi:carbohydrate porin [Geobacter sulfurreducens]|uniref:Outer membrane channel, OprB family n=1 Tax=Geobacter sulfurreducens (strain ATCC 51573 / DSM 12127 / PCA) TaxID=243231 RepID=Q747J5_GEOSL|nr:carbohydrate porin [Geobacter sulfurreducens]AAR36661.1 outer membrane channel, OprB family [Geobacter sulfurreducens PCA]UAC03926.1 carbohydrate porin [Geobacter sulfurreducens]UTG92566.1 carbohydrate porin [Geobacter sulfurreducens]HCD95144.1 carbohydrate porin [Geobacter sulfurreducens]